MENPLVDTELDTKWHLQGRIIPPSCSGGEGCVLHLQTKSESWAAGHYHTGRLPINSDAAVEFLSCIILPPEAELVRESMDDTEIFRGLDYLAMAKLSNPKDSIAFSTVQGMAVIVQCPGLSGLFGSSEKCKDCRRQEESKAMTVPAIVNLADFDTLMEIAGNDKSH